MAITHHERVGQVLELLKVGWQFRFAIYAASPVKFSSWTSSEGIDWGVIL